MPTDSLGTFSDYESDALSLRLSAEVSIDPPAGVLRESVVHCWDW